MDNQTSYARRWGLVSSLTFLSRIAGYFRDVVIAYFFGANIQTDAFYVAFRIPNLLRRLFAEGSLTVAFIPIFTEYNELRGKDEAKKVLNAIFTVLLIILLLLVILGIIFSPQIIKVFASGFDENTVSLAVKLNRIMFSYLIFISLTALSMGVLNSIRHFFAPAFSPVLFNISIIGCVFLFGNSFDIPIISIAVGVLLGGFLQLILNLYFLKSKDFMFNFTAEFNHPAVKRVCLLIAPQIFGIGVYNLNIIVNTQFASYMPSGTISYLYFAERLIEFPLGIIAVSIATVMLPSLSSDAAARRFEAFSQKYSDNLKLMLFIMIPAMFGLIALGKPICNLLYQHGEFDSVSVAKTSQALLGYAFGLFAVGGIRITVPAFYAIQNTKTPVIAAFAAFIVNAILCYVLGFIFNLDHFGLAAASSVSSILNFIILLLYLQKRLGNFVDRELIFFILKVTTASFFMGLIVYLISRLYSWQSSDITLEKLLYFIVPILIGVLFFLAAASLLKIKEFSSLTSMISRR
ncbi:MAG: murein biosynthesis integral membrane protein MurJ [Thermodesulfobacteriota bacterium]